MTKKCPLCDCMMKLIIQRKSQFPYSSGSGCIDVPEIGVSGSSCSACNEKVQWVCTNEKCGYAELEK